MIVEMVLPEGETPHPFEIVVMRGVELKQ